MQSLTLFFLCCLLQVLEASISLNFYNFMKEKRGKAFAESVARYDFGIFGSFGGGNHKGGEKTKFVIFHYLLGRFNRACFPLPRAMI
jgi:hypothetical protein